jgi:methionyl-tRNA formyltransferase
VRIVFAGTPDVAVPSLTALLASRHEVLAVLTRPDAPSGRGKKLTASPVATRAEAAGIEVLKPKRPKDEDFVARLTELAPDCCPVVAYGALLPQRVLDIPAHGWVNLHFSLLPAWRGAAPVQRAILAGDQVTGATTFRIVLELDAGPTYAAVTEPIRPDDTSGDLLHRLSLSGATLLVETLDAIEAGAEPQPQPDAEVSYASKINVEDAMINWARPADELDRLIRGSAPAPGAWTTFRGERFKINSARIAANNLPPGALEITKKSVQVGTATRALELGQVQAQGKKPMPAADWARGVSFDEKPALGG